MAAIPHLLYQEVPLYRPRLRIILYRHDIPVEVFGADSLSPTEIEIGVLNRACEHAGVSAVETAVLQRYHARAEDRTGDHVMLHYDCELLEFKLAL
jgi:hypothetical protein